MMKGEFESMTEICKVTPSLAPRPIRWDSCLESERHFFLCEFYDLGTDPPPVADFASKLAQLHKETACSSLNNMFGFHVNTYNGRLLQDNTWTASWEAFFSRGLRDIVNIEKSVQGPSDELEKLIDPLFMKVIPRLLGPLETEGRPVKPSLLHGDLWIGNIATKKADGQAPIFDSSAYYGHNECTCSHLSLCGFD